jgi:hypothetical protein
LKNIGEMGFRFLSLKFFGVLVFFLMVAFNGKSQETAPLFLLPDVSQSAVYNPAAASNQGKLIIGLPLLSGVSVNWQANSPFDALFSKGFSYSVSRLYDQLRERGKATATGRVSLFYASLAHNNYTFRLSVVERVVGSGAFDRDIVKIIRDGTSRYYGKDEYFGEADFHFQHFRELSFGISKRVWNDLEVGIAPKILFGKLGFMGSNLQLSVETDGSSEELLVKPEGNFILSAPFKYEYNEFLETSVFVADAHPGDYFFQPRNLGLALDGGVIFRPSKFSEISASLLDIGFTTLKHHTYNVDFIAPARYAKEDLYQSTNPDGENYLEPREALLAFGDTANYMIDAKETDDRKWFWMPLTVNISGKYRFSQKVTTGLNNQFTWFQNRPRNLLTVFVHSQPRKKLRMAGSLSVLNLATVRPGFGISWTNSNWQFYFASNNILGIFQPTSSKHLNLSLGMNLLFDTQK